MKSLFASISVAATLAPYALVTVGLVSIQSGALLMLCAIAASTVAFELLDRSADHVA